MAILRGHAHKPSRVDQNIADFLRRFMRGSISGAVRHTAVAGYMAVENAFVRTFLAKHGETVESAKLRLAQEQIARSIAKREALEAQLRRSA